MFWIFLLAAVLIFLWSLADMDESAPMSLLYPDEADE